MSNAITTYNPKVPAFFQQPKFMDLNSRFEGGISSNAPSRISFRGSRYRLISSDGVETPVTENGGTTLDVVVLDANPALSKFYYDKPYDPNSAGGIEDGPACYSEDGVHPSARSQRPQFKDCAACPHNAWGSKITPTGSMVKACGDNKKIAVIPVSDLAGDPYLLGIPGASLKAWSALVQKAHRQGVPLASMVIRLGFNSAASYPQLTFEAVSFVSQQQFDLISDLFGSPELDQLVGRGDSSHTGPFSLDAPATDQTAKPAAAPQSVAAQPVAAARIQPPQGMPMPAHTAQAIAQQPAPMQAAPEQPVATRRRRRPAAAAQPAPMAAPPMQQSPAQPATVASVPPTSKAMDDLLAQVMNG